MGDDIDNADQKTVNTDDEAASDDEEMSIMEGLIEIMRKQKKNPCKDYLCFPAEMDGSPSIGKAVCQCLTWIIISLVSLGFLGYYMFGDPDNVGDATCRSTDM